MKKDLKIKRLKELDNTLTTANINEIIRYAERYSYCLKAAYRHFKHSNKPKTITAFYMIKNGKSVEERQASRMKGLENPKTDRQKFIADKMNKGWSFSKAQYAWGNFNKGKLYIERNDYGLKYDDLIRLYHLDENGDLVNNRGYIKVQKKGPNDHLYYEVSLKGDSSTALKQVAAVKYCLYHKCDIKPGYCIHHKDFNKLNNDINNLQLLTLQQHMSIHSRARQKVQK